MAEILILKLCMVGNDSIMNKEYFTIFVEMRMRITIDFFSASCPSSMSNSTSCEPSLRHDLINHFIYAACLFQTMLGILNQPTFVFYVM